MEEESLTGKRKSEERRDNSNPKAIKSENLSTTSDIFSNVVKDVSSFIPSFSSSTTEPITDYPTIDLDGYIFQLWYKGLFSQFRDRDLIRIRSINKSNNTLVKDFICYRSQSELGLWRLASQQTINDPKAALTFDKFQYSVSTIYPDVDKTPLSPYDMQNKEYYYYGDYVQTTVLCIPLQCFINENFKILPLLDDSTNLNIFVEYETSHGGNTNIVKIVNIGGRNYNMTSPLSEVNNEYSGNMYLKHSTSQKKGPTSYNIPPREILSMDRQKSIPEFEKINRKYNTIDLSFDTNKFDEFKNYIREVITDRFEYIGIDEYCDCDFVFEGSLKFDGKFKMIEIKNNENGEKFYLYFAEGKLSSLSGSSSFESNIQELCKIEKAYAPITLVPEDGNTCNSYGLYSKYVAAGRLIGKLFDYNINVKLPNPIQCSNKYSFSGINYGEIFPFNQINKEPELLTQPETETQPLEDTQPEATQPLEDTQPEATQPLEDTQPEETQPLEDTQPEATQPLNETQTQEVLTQEVPIKEGSTEEVSTQEYKGGKRRRSGKKTKKHSKRYSKKKINKRTSRRRTLKRHRRKLHRSRRR
jgi:hypothetical protein